jgi:FMN phosphatase YigB (HAD superfamily)
MIKAVLLDLDDTLVESRTNEMFATYVTMLGDYGASFAPAELFGKTVLHTYVQILNSPDPTARLYDRFLPKFAANIKGDANTLDALFAAFYRECYPDLKSWVRPRPETFGLLDYLSQKDYMAVVATNPGLPEAAISQRMTWGKIPATDYPFALITTLEDMHFGKPQAEYYEEILLRLNLDPGEAIMVGNDWEQDIIGAATAGLCTYWVTENGSKPPDENIPISGSGSYREFVSQVENGWLETLTPPPPTPETLIHRLLAFPSAIDALRRTYRAEIMECRPAEDEWSARDIICHLRDHEDEEDRKRLERILTQHNPFLSANYDPWAHVQHYAEVSADEAFVEFTALRMKTVKWLAGLPPDVWARPARFSIFGPTYFEEMVRFTTEHDLTHLRQMLAAIDHALITCGP